MAKTNNAKEHTRQQSISAPTRKSNTYILRNRHSTRRYINTPYNVPTIGETSGTWYRVKPLRRINAIVASCWNYFTTIQMKYRSLKVGRTGMRIVCVMWDSEEFLLSFKSSQCIKLAININYFYMSYSAHKIWEAQSACSHHHFITVVLQTANMIKLKPPGLFQTRYGKM